MRSESELEELNVSRREEPILAFLVLLETEHPSLELIEPVYHISFLEFETSVIICFKVSLYLEHSN